MYPEPSFALCSMTTIINREGLVTTGFKLQMQMHEIW